MNVGCCCHRQVSGLHREASHIKWVRGLWVTRWREGCSDKGQTLQNPFFKENFEDFVKLSSRNCHKITIQLQMSGAQWPCTAFLQASWLGWKLALKKDSGLLGSHTTAQGEYSQMKEDPQHRHTNKSQVKNNTALWKEQQREKKILLTSFWTFLNLPILQTVSRSPQ